MQSLLLEQIREEYQRLLQLPATIPEQKWWQAIVKDDPVLFYLHDGVGILQIGEASRDRLLAEIKQLVSE